MIVRKLRLHPIHTQMLVRLVKFEVFWLVLLTKHAID